MERIEKKKTEKVSFCVRSQIALQNAINKAVEIKSKPVIIETLFYSWLIYCNDNNIPLHELKYRIDSIRSYVLKYRDISKSCKDNPIPYIYDEFRKFLESEI